MDGLMIDTEKLLSRFWQESARLHGFNMTHEDVLGIRSLAAKYAEPKLKEKFGENFDYQSIRAKRIELMNAYILENGIETKKGLLELLNFLKINRYKIAVATATDFERTKMYLNKIGIFQYFDEIICGSMVENGKPEPDIYIKACEKLGVEPEFCIALEDSPNGILSAYRAGCKPVMIPDLSEPDEETRKLLFAKFDSLNEVIELLKKIDKTL